ncbi:MAG: helix-turn-helix transcriptional regulator [Rhodospirillales bacterium]|nr:helix-turn-helix transcriptional regulator [Rhodospirillales bacterium]MCB9979715.1 helix-turn-helix transcriptional regulator [Rhodospirillales bacterium]
MNITTGQIRGARGILNWSQSDLSDKTGISTTSIGAIENGNTQPRENTLRIIRETFEMNGIEFIDNGVRLQSGQVHTYRGEKGFQEFFDYVLKVLQKQGGEVYISNVDEDDFVRWGGGHAQPHMRRTTDAKNIRYKILLKEGDTRYRDSELCEYKWIPKSQFIPVPFYLFANHLAIILFDPEPDIVVLHNPIIAEAYKRQFFAYWEKAAIDLNEIK